MGSNSKGAGSMLTTTVKDLIREFGSRDLAEVVDYLFKRLGLNLESLGPTKNFVWFFRDQLLLEERLIFPKKTVVINCAKTGKTDVQLVKRKSFFRLSLPVKGWVITLDLNFGLDTDLTKKEVKQYVRKLLQH